MSVSELAQTAGVNRTTFYKFFPNVNALYNACCEELTQRFLAVPIPAQKTPEAMLTYASALWELTAENNERIFTLSHRVKKEQLPFMIGHRLQEQLAASLTNTERASLHVSENLALFPELFSVWFSLIHIETLAPRIYPDLYLPVYRPERSLIENIADLFVVRYGGGFDFYYTLGGAAKFKELEKKKSKKTIEL